MPVVTKHAKITRAKHGRACVCVDEKVERKDKP